MLATDKRFNIGDSTNVAENDYKSYEQNNRLLIKENKRKENNSTFSIPKRK